MEMSALVRTGESLGIRAKIAFVWLRVPDGVSPARVISVQRQGEGDLPSPFSRWITIKPGQGLVAALDDGSRVEIPMAVVPGSQQVIVNITGRHRLGGGVLSMESDAHGQQLGVRGTGDRRVSIGRCVLPHIGGNGGKIVGDWDAHGAAPAPGCRTAAVAAVIRGGNPTMSGSIQI